MKELDKIIGYKFIKGELEKICDMFTNFEKYKKLGAEIPHGLLLFGAPGVGKTLMANCLIKASKRKAFVIRKNKPDESFVEEIQKTFDEALKNAPSIVFLDDMDKFANEDVFHKNADEFVTIQSCMDEVKDKGVFVLATANDLRSVPNSLLRAGRFCKKLEIEKPRGKDAEQIVKYYLGRKKYVDDIDTIEIARLLNGRSCAELETIINEAGIYAAFENKEKIEKCDIIKACMKILFDSPESDFCKSAEEKERTAVHEAGHTIVSEILEQKKVTLVSIANHTSRIGGLTSYYNDEQEVCTKARLVNRIKVALAGKAATEVVYGEVDVGANGDLHKAFDLVTSLCDDYCSYGFNKFIHHDASDELKSRLDSAVAEYMQNYYNETKNLIVKNRDFLDKLTAELVEKDTLLLNDIQKVRESCKIVL